MVGLAGSRCDEQNDTLGVARILMIVDIVEGRVRVRVIYSFLHPLRAESLFNGS